MTIIYSELLEELDPNLMSSFACYSLPSDGHEDDKSYFTEQLIYPSLLKYKRHFKINYSYPAASSNLPVEGCCGDCNDSVPCLLEELSIISNSDDGNHSEFEGGELAPRLSIRPTIYEIFSQNNIDWCRYAS
jgi:hypothetical protein